MGKKAENTGVEETAVEEKKEKKANKKQRRTDGTRQTKFEIAQDVVKAGGKMPARKGKFKDDIVDWEIQVRPIAEEFAARKLSELSLLRYLLDEGFPVGSLTPKNLKDRLEKWAIKLDNSKLKEEPTDENTLVTPDYIDIGSKRFWSRRVKIRCFEMYMRGDTATQIETATGVPARRIHCWAGGSEIRWDIQRRNLRLTTQERIKMRIRDAMEDFIVEGVNRHREAVQVSEAHTRTLSALNGKLIRQLHDLVVEKDKKFSKHDVKDFLEKSISFNTELKRAQKLEADIRKEYITMNSKIDLDDIDISGKFKDHRGLIAYLRTKYKELKNDLAILEKNEILQFEEEANKMEEVKEEEADEARKQKTEEFLDKKVSKSKKK